MFHSMLKWVRDIFPERMNSAKPPDSLITRETWLLTEIMINLFTTWFFIHKNNSNKKQK